MHSMRDTFRAIRPICVIVAGIGVVALAIAITGWQSTGFLLLGMLLMLGMLVVLRVHDVISAFHGKATHIEKTAMDAEQHYINVLLRVVKYVEARDAHSRGRSQRIGQLCQDIAQKMGLPSDKCALLNVAGQIHDIGMLAVPDSIINKKSRLGAEEFRSVKRHVEVGHEVLLPLKSLEPVLPAIRYHHERMNGTGYPDSLREQDIPLEARILAAADTFDAMTHDRPHRPAMSPFDAICELKRCSPAGYDKAVVTAIARVVNMDQPVEAEPAEVSSSAASA